MTTQYIIAAIGCSGPVAQHFVQGFCDEGVAIRILARDPRLVAERYREAEVIQGSMMNADDVACAVDGVDAAFLVTPMGLNNDPASEIEAAKRVIEGVRKAGLRHLIYTSCLGVDRKHGVGILDAKHEIEQLIRESGIPYSILRCGTYMEDLFDSRMDLLEKGKFLFPLRKDRRFMFTSQRDVPRFAVRELLAKTKVLGTAIDLVAPGTYSIAEIEKLLSQSAGFPITAPSRFPTFHIFLALLPLFRFRKDRMSSVIPLLVYFDQYGYLSPDPASYEGFQTTRLEDHLHQLFQKNRSL